MSADCGARRAVRARSPATKRGSGGLGLGLAIVGQIVGACVETVESAREALAQLQTGGVDLLLSDISMPGEDGFWLIYHVRSSADPRLKQMPALALTAYARAEDRDRALGAGFHMYLSKPIHPDEVVKVAGDLMSRLVVSDASPSAHTHRTQKAGQPE